MTTKMLQLIPLTAPAFQPFGDVISVETSQSVELINRGHTQRFNQPTELALTQPGFVPALSIFRSEGWQLPVPITALERHPHSSQSFIPLGNTPFIIVVAPPGELVESEIRAFMSSPGQGINYRPGTWHHFHMAHQQQADFLVIDVVGEPANCDEAQLLDPITLCH